jgi:hypothetical protein
MTNLDIGRFSLARTQPLLTSGARIERFECREVADSYTGDCGHEHGLYRRMSFASGESLQLPTGFPSQSRAIGEPSMDGDAGWTRNLGEIPKDCYYCKGTGKCYMDTPELGGGGEDYMGATCKACSGSGVCPRCGGDGVIGRPGSTTESTH